jgi:hypothetical protein
METNKILQGYWLSFEYAKAKYNIEPSDVSPECIDWYNHRIFIGKIYEN